MRRTDLSRRTFLKGGAAVGATLAAAQMVKSSPAEAVTPPIVLENSSLIVAVDAGTGEVVRLYNKLANLELIDTSYTPPASAAPWKIESTPGSSETDWVTPQSVNAAFSYVAATDRIDLTWSCTNGMTVHAAIVLEASASDATFTASVTNSGSAAVSVLEYPVLRGIGRLAGAATGDYLLHSYATGFLLRNPLDLFKSGTIVPESPYPEGYAGATTQLMAYYGAGAGGFYLATHDSSGWAKWLDFFLDDVDPMQQHLKARFLHSAPGIGPGNELDLPYAVHVGALTDGTWYEAADRYRDWATTQPFCQRGPLRTRADRSTWLLEDVGFAVFGSNTEYDRTGWLQYFHGIANLPVFHVSGPNWQAGGYDYLGNYNGGQDRVFPTAITPSFTSTLSANNDRWAAFSFGTLFNDKTSVDYVEAQASLLAIPGRDTPNKNTLALGNYSLDPAGTQPYPYLCPVPELQTTSGLVRDAGVCAPGGADAIYWDIGPCTYMQRCLNPSHGHPVGGGSEVPSAQRASMARVRAACATAAGAYVPLGTEMVNELYLPELDFYQARAEASPASIFEAFPFRKAIKAGTCEKVPLFAYIYHEYGPIRLDGWGRLSAEQGNLFYWLAARVFAWGGLYELNYEFTSLDVVSGTKEDITQSYYPVSVERDDAAAAGPVAFLAELAKARTGFANPYVAYGRMLRPLSYNNPQPADASFDYFLYDAPPDAGEYQDAGTLTRSTVVHAAWRFADTKCGFLFINVAPTSQTVNVTVDPSQYGLATTAGLHAFSTTLAGSTDLGAISGSTSFALTLNPRTVSMLELRQP